MFRLDRALTLSFFSRFRHMMPSAMGQGIPILMYHSISHERDTSVHPYYETHTSPKTFASQMSLLVDEGYRVLNLRTTATLLKSGEKIPQKTVALTFDDGFEDFYSNAFPVLASHGFPSTVFLPTAYVEKQNNFFKGKKCLSWGQVRELNGQGVHFGSHTDTHPQLLALSFGDARRELQESKEKIEEKLGKEVDCFSYPYAFPEHRHDFVRKLEKFLKAAGYRCGVTTKIGLSDKKENSLFLKRIPANEHDDPEFFLAKLEGCYDWVHHLQSVFKHARKHLNCR